LEIEACHHKSQEVQTMEWEDWEKMSDNVISLISINLSNLVSMNVLGDVINKEL
jgi:hypothetical protein